MSQAACVVVKYYEQSLGGNTMTSRGQTNPNTTARIAGFLYLLLAPLGFFGAMYIPSITVPDNPATTVRNVLAAESLFRLSILSALATPVVTVLVALVLYRLFKPVSRSQAALMVVFTVVAAPIAMLTELCHFAVLLLVGGADYLKVFNTDQLHSLVLLALNAHHYGAFIAQLFWGFWLFPMGYLVFRSGFLPRFIGVLLVIAGLGYVADSLLLFLLPDLKVIFSQYTFIGEVFLLLWLLIKGVDVERWERRSVVSL
jgi:hypothetical protein